MPERDGRRIQTAVVGAADAHRPVVLPLEAIELDAFRRTYAGLTFWCGTWLGGCGRQLTTKLYTDRVCHFAHHAAQDGQRCARSAHDVASADHLYVKTALEELLRGGRVDGEVLCSPPGPAPVGSLVRLRISGVGELQVHMNTATAPDWDSPAAELRIAVAEHVPVERRVLQRLPYLHRVRCDTAGTGRQVMIGTQTARGTAWYLPHECSFGPTGLHTPALDDLPGQPIAPRPAAPTGSAAMPRAGATVPVRMSGHVRRLLLQLGSARTRGDLSLARELIRECDGLLAKATPQPPRLRQERDAAQAWVTEYSREVTRRRAVQAAATQATLAPLFAELEIALRQEWFGDVRVLLRTIKRQRGNAPLPEAQTELLDTAQTRIGNARGKLQTQASRKKWIKRSCPTCRARPGRDCTESIPGDPRPHRRPGGHDTRIHLELQARKTGAATPRIVKGGATGGADQQRRTSQR